MDWTGLSECDQPELGILVHGQTHDPEALNAMIQREQEMLQLAAQVAKHGPELQLMVREELSRTKEDGTLMYPHLQKFMPPVPSRFVQTRESTQVAISDTYNGDGKVYSALRAAAYVSWGIVTSLGAPSETGLRA